MLVACATTIMMPAAQREPQERLTIAGIGCAPVPACARKTKKRKKTGKEAVYWLALAAAAAAAFFCAFWRLFG